MSRIPPPPPATATIPGLIATLQEQAERTDVPAAAAGVMRVAAAQLGVFAEQLTPPTDDAGHVQLHAESGVSARDGAPMVQFRAFGRLVQLRPEAAREVALTLLAALTRDLDIDPPAGAGMTLITFSPRARVACCATCTHWHAARAGAAVCPVADRVLPDDLTACACAAWRAEWIETDARELLAALWLDGAAAPAVLPVLP